MKIDRSCDMKLELEMIIIAFRFRSTSIIMLPHHYQSPCVFVELWNGNGTVNDRETPIKYQFSPPLCDLEMKRLHKTFEGVESSRGGVTQLGGRHLMMNGIHELT
jgi:hypothetical protein